MLRYSYNKPALKTLKIISTPSYSKYLTLNEITMMHYIKNIVFVTTNWVLLIGLLCKKNIIGGKILFIA
jgi:ribosomal protein S8